MAKQRWEVRSLDVWGNQEDGYEVNQEYAAGHLSFSRYPSEDAIFKALKRDGFIKAGIKRSQVEIDGAGPDYYDVNDAATGKPIYSVTLDESHSGAVGGKRRSVSKRPARSGQVKRIRGLMRGC
jgi:hypothetical protein